MCNAYNHPPGCTCGWGGDGHLGGGYGQGGFSYSESVAASYDSDAGEARPSTCRYCGQDVSVYTNDYGSFVLFDALGQPWPKHECSAAPAFYAPTGYYFNLDHHITDPIHSLYPEIHNWTLRPTVKVETRRTARSAIEKLRTNGQFPLGELLRMLLTHLKRDELVFPCTCGTCEASTVMLHVRGENAVLLSDVWNGQIHLCHRELGRVSLPHKFTFREFLWLMTGIADFAGKPAKVWQAEQNYEGLVVEVYGGSLKLLTSNGLVGKVPAPKIIHPMDYIRLTAWTAERPAVERLALLKGGGGSNFKGWSKKYRFVNRTIRYDNNR